MKKTAILALICLGLTACDDSKTLSDGDGKVTLSASCTAAEEASCTTSLDGKNYYFGLAEQTAEFDDCDGFLDGNNNVDPAAATYFSSTEKTSETTACTVDGCNFSTTKTYNQEGKRVSGLKAATYIAVLWVDVDEDNTFNTGDFVSCLDDGDAPVLADTDQTFSFDLEPIGAT